MCIVQCGLESTLERPSKSIGFKRTGLRCSNPVCASVGSIKRYPTKLAVKDEPKSEETDQEDPGWMRDFTLDWNDELSEEELQLAEVSQKFGLRKHHEWIPSNAS